MLTFLDLSVIAIYGAVLMGVALYVLERRQITKLIAKIISLPVTALNGGRLVLL